MMTRFALGTPKLLAAASAILLLASVGHAAAPAPGEDFGSTSLSGTYLAARTADAEKDITGAAGLYRSALRSDPANLFLLERALVLTAASGDVEQARSYAADLIAKAPTNDIAKLITAVELIKEKNYAKAVELLRSPTSGVLADLTNALLTAWANYGQGEIDKAIVDLKAVKGEDWYEPFKLLHTGYIAMASGRIAEALSALKQAHKLDPNTIRVTEAYARALAVVKKRDEAVAVLDDFLKGAPDNALALSLKADIASGKPVTATVATPVDGAAEALAGIGALVGQEGGLEVSSLYLQLSLFMDHDAASGLAALSLGSLLDGNGQGPAAIEAFQSVAAQSPFRGLAALREAVALDRMDRTPEAEKAFQEALRRNPDDLQAYVAYGNMLRGRERYTEAADVYSKAIALVKQPERGDWNLFYFRGISYERTNTWDKAEGDFKEALKLYPDQPYVLNYLGYSWVDKGLHLDEGMAMIRKAVDLRSNDGFTVDSLGWAYYRRGQYDDAVRELERAIALQPDDPTIHDHLGDAYWKAGRTLEAQFQWRHARDFGAKGADLERILKKIAERKLIEQPKDAADAGHEPAPAPAASGSAG